MDKDKRIPLDDAAVHRLAYDYLRVVLNSAGMYDEEVTEENVEGLLDGLRRNPVSDEFPYRAR